NPRLGLCHYFGTRCGVNLTLDAYRLTCGEDLPARVPQIEGTTFLAVLEEIGGRLDDGASVLAVLRGLLLALLRRPVGAYFAWDDIWPGPSAVVRIAYRVLSKARRGQLRAVHQGIQLAQGGRVPRRAASHYVAGAAGCFAPV